ncbi:MAG: protein-L-isoaspartate(D-aspartate) O-methyltransferase [Alphaproteobacteria bacterium]|nr:protein-L-isoaspartate(D-aspartate) O-methyltransferase [Alphaproteobacteria bacterium]
MADHPRKDSFAAAREKLIREIETLVAKFGTGDGDFVLDAKVLDALGKVPREKFVPAMEKASAYANQPLPIGHRQTISQPLIVAMMTHHLKIEPSNRVLEIGTGSGYQTAVLAELASDIVTIENVSPLARMAKAALEELGYHSIRFIEGDGRRGAPGHAPFDRILITAAANALPETLLEQLALGGRLVAPVGKRGTQQLILATKSSEGKISQRQLFPVAFVPLTYGP